MILYNSDDSICILIKKINVMNILQCDYNFDAVCIKFLYYISDHKTIMKITLYFFAFTHYSYHLVGR